MQVDNFSPNHKALIHISSNGIKESIYKYKGRRQEISPETKRSLFYLDEIIKNARYSHIGKNKPNHEHIDHVEVYYLYYQREGRLYKSHIVVFIHNSWKQGEPLHEFHYIEVNRITAEEIKKKKRPD